MDNFLKKIESPSEQTLLSQADNKELSDFYRHDFKERVGAFFRRWLMIGMASASLFLAEKIFAPIKFFSGERDKKIKEMAKEEAEQEISSEIVAELSQYYQRLALWQRGAEVEWDETKGPVLLQEQLDKFMHQAGFSDRAVDVFLRNLKDIALDRIDLQEDISRYIGENFLSYRLFSAEILQALKDRGSDLSVSPYLLQPAVRKISDNLWLLNVGVLDQRDGKVYLGDDTVVAYNVGSFKPQDLWFNLQQAVQSVVDKIKKQEITAKDSLTVSVGDRLSLDLPGSKEWNYEQTDLILYDVADHQYTKEEREWLKNHRQFSFVFLANINELPTYASLQGELLLQLGRRLQISPYVEQLMVLDENNQLVAEYNIFEQIEKMDTYSVEGEVSLPVVIKVSGKEFQLAEYDSTKINHFTVAGRERAYHFYDLVEPGREQGILQQIDRSVLGEQLDELHYDTGKSSGEVVNKLFVYLIDQGSGGTFDIRRDSVAVFLDPTKYEELLAHDNLNEFLQSTVRHEFWHALDYRYRLSVAQSENNYVRRFFYQSKRDVQRLRFLYQLAESRLMNDDYYGGHPQDNEREFFASLMNSLYLPIDKNKLNQHKSEFLAWYNEALLYLALRFQQIDDLRDAPINKKIIDRIMQVDKVLTEKLAGEGRYEYLFYPLLNDDVFNDLLSKADQDFCRWLVDYLTDKINSSQVSAIINEEILSHVNNKLVLLREKIN